MGEVFLAEDVSLRRRVALKVLAEAVASNQERLRRFLQEAQAASALDHPNILTVYEFSSEGGQHFLATEYVEGQTLRELIAQGPLSVAKALDIAAQTASALSAANRAGITPRHQTRQHHRSARWPYKTAGLRAGETHRVE